MERQEEEPSKQMKQQVFNIRQFACLEGLSVREEEWEVFRWHQKMWILF